MDAVTSAPPPIPVAIRLPSDVVLRGHEWSVDGPALVLVHDLGDALDAWGSLPSSLARAGFRVISMELAGHGLSDGETDPETVLADVRMLLREISESFGPVALVAYGAVSESLLYLGEVDRAPVHAMISPTPLDPEGITWSATKPAIRLVLSGTLNETGHSYLKGIHPKMRGQNMWVSGASPVMGPELLVDQPQLVEHLVMFMRKYIMAFHLAWIAERADYISKASQNGEEDADGEDQDHASS